MVSDPRQDAPANAGVDDIGHMTKLQSLVMHGMQEGIFIVGGDDTVQDVNAAIEEMFGYPRDF